MLNDILHTTVVYIFVIMTQAHFFDVFSCFLSCFSNPDLRRSELSLDAVLQRTSSNSSSSSSPSSQGGSTERRGMTHAHVQMHGHAAKQSETRGMSTRARCEFPRLSAGRCLSQFCSDPLVRCAQLHIRHPWRCRRGHRGDRDRCGGTCQTRGQRETS